jgi:Protein kinase domain
MGMTSNYRQPVILQHRKPSMAKNYYIKNDFANKKEGYPDVNLSASQAERGHSNRSGAELAWAVPQSRGNSINAGNTNGLNNSHQSTAGNLNFRIHAGGSGNVSRETSATKRMRESNLQLVAREDSQKPAPKLQMSASNATLGERRRSRILLSRGGTNQAAGMASVDQPLRQQTPSSQQVLPRAQIADISPKASPTPPNGQSYLVLSQLGGGLAKGGATPTNNSSISTTAIPRKPAPVELPTGDFPTVIWADQLNGEDIRTELKFGDCLGQGSFAKVYEGFDKRLKIPVAIKVIDKRKIKDNETKKRQLIEEELFIFCRLNHKNIVKFIRLVEDTKRVTLESPRFSS